MVLYSSVVRCGSYSVFVESTLFGPKSAKHKKERAADFKKAKLKLGKGKLAATNATNTSIASKGIALPTQSLSTAGSKGGEPTSRRNLTVAELLVQSRHYSTPVKKQALQELSDLVTVRPDLVQRHLLPLTTALAHLVADASASVRALVRHLVAYVATTLPHASFVQVCAPPIILFTLAALSSLEDPIRIDALRLVDTLLAAIPSELVRGFDPAEVQSNTNESEAAHGPRILDALLSLLKVRAPTSAATQVLNGGMTAAKAATLSDLSPEARLAVLSTLETFLRAASARETATGGDEPWYLAGAFDSHEAYLDFLAAHPMSVARSDRTIDTRAVRSIAVEPFAQVEDPTDYSLQSLGLYAAPVASTSSAQPSLLSLLHPTLLSSFLDSAPTALNPSVSMAATSTSDDLSTVTAVVSLARQLFTIELAGGGGGGGGGDPRPTARTNEARKLLVAFLTHASPYFPFGADAIAATNTTTKRPTAAQQAEEDKFLSLNLSFAELSSLLVLLTPNVSSELDGAGRKLDKKGKSRKDVEGVVIERVQEWVVQALRGELSTASSPMGLTLSPTSFLSLTPTLWALLNQTDTIRSIEVFSAAVDYLARQNTNASYEGRTGLAKRRAMEFTARCVLVHSSPSYTAPFDLSPLASRLPESLSPNAKEVKQNALARWLVMLPKYLWELSGNGSSPPREEELQLILTVLLKLVQQGEKGLISPATLASLSPLLSPFFHLVHLKSQASLPGPFTRLGESSLASRQALDLVFLLSQNGTAATVGLVQAVDKACEIVGGEVAQKWTSLRTTTL